MYCMIRIIWIMTSTFVPCSGCLAFHLLKAPPMRYVRNSLSPNLTLRRVTFTDPVRHSSWSTILSPSTRTAMAPVPNQVYTAFSFLGFILCAVPFYWHLEGTSNFRCRLRTRDLRTLPCSLERRHMYVHGLDRSWVFDPVRQLDRLEQKHHQPGTGLL